METRSEWSRFRLKFVWSHLCEKSVSNVLPRKVFALEYEHFDKKDNEWTQSCDTKSSCAVVVCGEVAIVSKTDHDDLFWTSCGWNKIARKHGRRNYRREPGLADNAGNPKWNVSEATATVIRTTRFRSKEQLGKQIILSLLAGDQKSCTIKN